jgi:hypothetical protein
VTARRTVSVALAWAAALVVATGVGLTAVGSIGSGIVDAGQPPLSAEQVDAQLAAARAAPDPALRPSPTAAPAPAPVPSPVPVPGDPGPTTDVVASEGGTVVARCGAGPVQIVSVSPAQGFRVHGDGGSDHPGRVRFESERARIEIQLSCVAGRPVGTVERDDR